MAESVVERASAAIGDAAMNARFDRIGLGRFAGSGERLARAVTIASVSFGRSLLWLLAAIIVGCGVWMLLPLSRGNSTEPVKSDVASGRTGTSGQYGGGGLADCRSSGCQLGRTRSPQNLIADLAPRRARLEGAGDVHAAKRQ